jgi:hypothetical protein
MSGPRNSRLTGDDMHPPRLYPPLLDQPEDQPELQQIEQGVSRLVISGFLKVRQVVMHEGGHMEKVRVTSRKS